MPSKNYHVPITGTPDIRTALNTALEALDDAIGDILPNEAAFGVEEADSTDNGSTTSTTWTALDGYDGYEVDGDFVVVPVSGYFTPKAGTHILKARHTYGGSSASGARLRLNNVTQGSAVKEGLCVKTQGGQQMLSLMAIFTANGTDTYRLEAYAVTANTNDLGVAQGLGTKETYADIMLMRVGLS